MPKIALAVAAASVASLMSIAAAPVAAQSVVDPPTALDCANSSDCALIMVERRPDGGWIMLPPAGIATGPRYTNMLGGIDPAYGDDIRYTNLGDVETGAIVAPDTDLACVDASNCGYVLAVTSRGVEMMPRYWTRQ